MDSSDDLEDHELFLATIVSHLRLVAKFVVGFSLNWTTLACCLHSLQLLLMRPETFAFVSIMLLIFFFSHTFDLWSGFVFKRLPYKWRCYGFLGSSGTAPGQGKEGLRPEAGLEDVEEFKEGTLGLFALRGRRPKMEDKWDFADKSKELGIELFGVFDGHGGDTAAVFVKNRLFKQIIQRASDLITKGKGSPTKAGEPSGSCPKTSIDANKKTPQEECKKESKQKNGETEKAQHDLSVESLSKIITEEMLAIDEQLNKESKSRGDFSGSTALVALKLTAENILMVANVGDSRGVICDGKGNTIPVSYDHKPQQLKEHKRIKEAGGFIKFNGVWRVAGILATSRAFGDYPLKDKKLVIAEPDILAFDLNDVQPQFLILASDGLWDTFSNEEAVNYVKDNLENLKKKKWKKTDDLALEVAKSLVFEAYRRYSLDNVTVLIVLFDPNSFERRASLTCGVSTGNRRKSSVMLSSRTT